LRSHKSLLIIAAAVALVLALSATALAVDYDLRFTGDPRHFGPREATLYVQSGMTPVQCRVATWFSETPDTQYRKKRGARM